MSPENSNSKNGSTLSKDNNHSVVILAVSTFAVLSFLVIFFVVSLSVKKSVTSVSISPADWKTPKSNTSVIDSAQISDISTSSDTSIIQIDGTDTLSFEEMLEKISKLKKRIIIKHTAVITQSNVKKEIKKKLDQLNCIKNELYSIKKEHDEIVSYRRNLPSQIISTVGKKLSEGQQH